MFPATWSMTLIKTQCYLRKCQASKSSLNILIQSHSLALALLYCIRTKTFQLLHVAVVEPLSSAWPVFATVNSWNPLAWVGVVWAMMCLLIYACLLCLLLLRVVSGLIHRGWIGMWSSMSYCWELRACSFHGKTEGSGEGIHSYWFCHCSFVQDVGIYHFKSSGNRSYPVLLEEIKHPLPALFLCVGPRQRSSTKHLGPTSS